MSQINVKTSKPNNKTVKHSNEQNINTTLGFGEVTPLGFIEMQGKTKAKGFIGSLIRTATMPVPTFGEISYKTYARFIPTTDIFRNNENLKAELPITTQFGTFIPTDQPKCKVNLLSYRLLYNYCYYNVYRTTEQLKRNGNNISMTGLVSVAENNSLNNKFRKLIAEYINYKFTGNAGKEDYKLEYNELADRLVSLSWYDKRITTENADFVIVRAKNDKIDRSNNSEVGVHTTFGNDETAYVYVFRLNKYGKTLKRILENLGWKYSLRNEEYMNILPLLAYYKGYFELFQPKNTATNANVYTNKNCYKLTDYICEHDIKDVIVRDVGSEIDDETGEEVEYARWTDYTELFFTALDELSYTYYYNKPNLITAHIATPSISNTTAVPSTNSPTNLSEVKYVRKNNNEQPLQPTTSSVITAPSLKLLMKMYVLSNKQSVIGGNIRKLIQSIYGYDPDTLDGIVYDCGRNSYDLEISMIPSQSDTVTENGGAQLGEIGGLAMGKSSKGNNGGLKWECKADVDGYLIFYAVIVPNCQFYQGTDPRLKHGTNGKYSLYQSDFDSLGYEISTKSIINAERLVEIPSIGINGTSNVVGTDEATENIPFGFIPRYMDYKVLAGDIVSGDLRRLAYRKQLAPYYMGKEIRETGIYSEEYEENKYRVLLINESNIPVATPELRSVGKYNWLDNFNKIFYQNESEIVETYKHIKLASWEKIFGYDDPFIIHNTNTYDKWDKMKPTTESFETDGEENNAVEVEHA